MTCRERGPTAHRRLAIFLDDVGRLGVGAEQVAVLQQAVCAGSLGLNVIRDVLRGLGEAHGESSVPEREWRSLLEYFDANGLGALLGTSESNVKRYAGDVHTTPDLVADRLHWLALVVGYLSGSYNDYGIRRWFQRPRQRLGGRSPREALLAEGDWTPDGPAARSVECLAMASIGMTVT